MRRVARHVFTILSALSLLLCVAVGVLWVRSYWQGPFGEFIGSFEGKTGEKIVMMRNVGAYSSYGYFGFGINHSEFVRSYAHYAKYADGRRLVWSSVYGFERFPFTHEPGYQKSRWEKLGFAARDSQWHDQVVSFQSEGAAVPHWFLVVLTAVLPLHWLARRSRRYVRLKWGYCGTCGYDLRAHSPGDRCPECGAGREMQKSEC